ncbi:MAG: alpha/beta fold hydrolase [Acidobacteria bacterium]|nr:alpha/beta fold hydrolase [Acidobacteriota bacterium]
MIGLDRNPQFLRTAGGMGLIDSREGRYRLLPKLLEKQDFDEIRLHNLVTVYANEVAPIPQVVRIVTTAVERARLRDDRALSRMRFEDELRSHELDRQRFDLPQHQEVNRHETATENGEPFLILPRGSRSLGVVLVHGLLASPAEVRHFGERLGKEGYPVMGVRLKGHGTSPWDLREREWEEWLGSVRRGFGILAPFASRLCLVGFSTGGALSLLLAAESPSPLVGVAAASVPVRLKEPAMIFVPLLHGANRVTRWISSLEGVKPFHNHRSEHPHINYSQVPVRSLYELRGMVKALEEKADRVGCPTLLLQGTGDPVVDPDGARLLQRKVGERTCRLEWVPSSRHGILNEDIAGTQARVLSFLSEL